MKIIAVQNYLLSQHSIPSVTALNKLRKRLVAPCMAFVQIYQVNGWRQYNIRNSVRNVPTNIDKIQSTFATYTL